MRSDLATGHDPLLVVFAHPDDEFAVFPWLKRAVEGGRPVQAVWLTDGGWGGQDVGRRRAESLKVLGRLGLAESAAHFCGIEWGVPDGGLHELLDEVTSRLLDRFGHDAVGGEVMMPAWEGGHHDHDASHLVGIALGRARRAAMTQYSLYHGRGLSGPFFHVLAPLDSNGPQESIATTLGERIGYAAACLSYRSQWRSFAGLLPFYVWRMRRADAFCRQPVEPGRTAERPHEGPMLYERRGGPTWEAFAQATSRHRYGTMG